MTERTLIILKPDAIQRHLAGEITGRLERKGFKLVGAKFMRVPRELAEGLYAVHKTKAFYDELIEYICSAPVLVTVWEGEGVVAMSRRMIGSTFGFEAEPGTIRGDFSASTRYNLVHGSDRSESAEQEIAVFFKSGELIDYEFGNAPWLYGKKD